GLDHVPPGPVLRRRRVEENDQPLNLVILQDLYPTQPAHHHGGHQGEEPQACQEPQAPRGGARAVEHHEGDGDEGEGGAQVRLQQDQDRGEGGQAQGDPDGQEGVPVVPAPQRRGQGDDRRHPGQPRGREVDGPDDQPAPGARDDGARHEDGHQEKQGEAQQVGGPGDDHPVIPQGGQDHGGQPHPQPDRLADDVLIGAGGARQVVGGTVDHRQPYPRQEQGDDDQRPVSVLEVPPFEHRAPPSGSAGDPPGPAPD